MASPSASSVFLLLLLPTILAMPSPYSETAPVQICVRTCPTEVNLRLYLHQFVAGPNHPNRNEEFVISTANPFNFGTTLIHDWILTKTTDPSDAIVARVQGTHIQAGTTNANSWYISQNIVFQNTRFAGSTLQVMGTLTENSVGQWSIVGGTGEFKLAQGIISYSLRPKLVVSKMDIHSFLSIFETTNLGRREYKMDVASNKDDGIRELNIRILYDADAVQAAPLSQN